MNAVDLLDHAAGTWPDTPAIIDGPAGHESVTTFAALAHRSRRLASLFAMAGLQAGDGIVIMLPMSAALYAAIAAAWRLGLVPVFMDPAAGENHFASCLRRYPVRAFLGSYGACLLRMTSPALRKIPTAFVAGAFFPGARSLRAALSLQEHKDNYPATADAAAMIAYTSGSTGRPKGILRTHGLLLSTHTILSAHVRPPAGAVTLATLPIVALANLACGATSLIPDANLRRPGLIDPRRLVDQLERWQTRSGFTSPALLERVADHCLERGRKLECLREIYVGGAPVYPRLLDKLTDIAPRAKVWIVYGSTEAEPIALVSRMDLSAEDLDQTRQGHGLLVGKPVPEIRLRILRDRWGEARADSAREALDQDTLNPGAAGEIVVTGPHVTRGYLAGEGDAETKFRAGDEVWHRTGDAGWLDERGRLWLLGPCSARTVDAAGTLYPYSVEAALSFDAGIARSAFLSHRGERLLVLESGKKMTTDARALLTMLAWAKLAAVLFVRRIPVDSRHNAKVDYPALRRALDARTWLQRVDNR